MQRSIVIKIKLPRNSFFWLSLILHLILLICFFLFVNLQPNEQQKRPNLYVPSYVYKGSMTPPQQHTTTSNTQTKQTAQATQSTQPSQRARTSKQSHNHLPVSPNGISLNSILASTQTVVQQSASHRPPREEDPIYLVGDSQQEADPLIRMLGKALSAHFEYPRIAGEFGVTGRAVLAMTLHPEGYLSDIEIVKSSNNADLDAAALYSANNAPKIDGVDRFITAPKRFVIGYIFDTAPPQ